MVRAPADWEHLHRLIGNANIGKWNANIGQMEHLHRPNGTPASVIGNGYMNPLNRETVGVVER